MVTASDSRDQILMLLGELKEGLKGVKEDIADIKDAADDDRRDSADSRRRMYEKLDDGEKKTTQLESTVRVMAGIVEKASNRLDALEPEVRKTRLTIKAWTLRGGAIATALAAFGGFIWFEVTNNAPAIWAAFMHFLQQGPVK